MTHDELLDQVQKMWDVDGVHELYKALRAVVELHKPIPTKIGDLCNAHAEILAWKMCPTIQAITEQLK